MDAYIARQPIFDVNMNIFGYELLYRKSMNNFYEGFDDSKSTAELISNAFLTMPINELTDGTKAFINFSEDMLLKNIPLLLPQKLIIVEILERVEINDNIIDACKVLKENGCILALDDFIFSESYRSLLELTDIIKIEFPNVSHEKQKKLIKQYGDKIKFLAEKVETREEYEVAVNLGYDYFQGYFFSKPVIIKYKEIGYLNSNLLKIIDELNKEEPEYDAISSIIETDLGLSYKILKISNSVFYEAKNEIKSVKQALVRFGFKQIKEWIYLMLLKEIQCVDNKELVKNSLIRAKLMELIAIEAGKKEQYLDYFLTGMFSSIDVLLNRSMSEIIKDLPLSDDVVGALLEKHNEIRMALDQVLYYETATWNKANIQELFPSISQNKFMMMYIKALKWVMSLDY